MALLDNSLLVYTSDNTLYHFLVIPTKETIKLHLCGSISFQGILQVPSRVRALSWMIPQAQKGVSQSLLFLSSLSSFAVPSPLVDWYEVKAIVKGRWLMIELGDPADDLIVATIIFLVDGKLVLLRPRRVSTPMNNEQCVQ
jgi:hypothetical protein